MYVYYFDVYTKDYYSNAYNHRVYMLFYSSQKNIYLYIYCLLYIPIPTYIEINY